MGATSDCEESASTMALQSEESGTTKDQRTAAKKKDKERLLPADDEDSQASGGDGTDKTKDGGKAPTIPFSQPMKLDYDDTADCPVSDFADEESKSSAALPGHAPRHPPSGADLYEDMPLAEFRSQAEQRLSELVSRIQTRTASAKKRFQMMDLTPEERVEVAEFIYEASYREWKAEQDAGTAHFRRNGNADTSGGRGISSRTGSKNPDAGTAGSEHSRVVTDLMLDAGEAEGGGPEPLGSASNNSNDKKEKQDQDVVDFSFSGILEAFSVSQEELRAILFGAMDEQKMKQDAHHDPGGVGKEDEIDAATDSKSASGNANAKAKKKLLTSTSTTVSNGDETDREQKTPVPLGDMPDDGEESTVGRKWYLEGNFAEAIACWERTLKSIAYVDSKSGYTGSRLEELRNLEYSTHLNLAQAYIKNSQYAKALESCDKVLEERFQGYKEAAEKAEKLRVGAGGTKPEDAPSDQEETIHPFLLKALYRRAMAFKSRGAREDFSKALECLQLLLKLDPGNQAAAALYGDTWRLNKIEKRKEKQNMRRIFDSKAEIVTDYESCKRFRQANFLNPDTGAEETSRGVLVSFLSRVQEESGSVWRKLKRIWGPRFEKVCGKRKNESRGELAEPVASSGGAPEGRDKSSKRNDSPAWRKDLLRQAREEAMWEENQQKIARKSKRT